MSSEVTSSYLPDKQSVLVGKLTLCNVFGDPLIQTKPSPKRGLNPIQIINPPYLKPKPAKNKYELTIWILWRFNSHLMHQLRKSRNGVRSYKKIIARDTGYTQVIDSFPNTNSGYSLNQNPRSWTSRGIQTASQWQCNPCFVNTEASRINAMISCKATYQ